MGSGTECGAKDDLLPLWGAGLAETLLLRVDLDCWDGVSDEEG